jgi:hypothetical protein
MSLITRMSSRLPSRRLAAEWALILSLPATGVAVAATIAATALGS